MGLDREKVKFLAIKLDEVLALFEVEGYTAKRGNGSFNDSNVTFKIEVASVLPDGTVLDKSTSALKGLATAYGLPADVQGRRFERNGKIYEVAGCAPKSHKFPILAKDISTGKLFKFTPEAVKLGLI